MRKTETVALRNFVHLTEANIYVRPDQRVDGAIVLTRKQVLTLAEKLCPGGHDCGCGIVAQGDCKLEVRKDGMGVLRYG